MVPYYLAKTGLLSLLSIGQKVGICGHCCCANSGSKLYHQCKIAEAVSRVIRLNCCKVGRSEDMSSIFIYSYWI